MQNILIVFFIVCFFVMIMVFPFKIRFMGHFNFINLIGFYSLKILKVKLINGKISYDKGKIIVQNSVNILQDKFNNDYSQILAKELMSKIDISKVEIYFSGGISDNSFSSAIICGSVSSIIQSIYSFLSQKYYGVKLYEDVDAMFGKDKLEVTFDFVINISFISIIISVISSLKKYKVVVNNEK